ncbi:hypothetical protein ACFWFQ_38100, partial [Nocardia salmonicida]
MSAALHPDDIARQLARLAATESIIALKHRYFRACDAKDPVHRRLPGRRRHLAVPARGGAGDPL